MSYILSSNCRGLGSIPASSALRRIVINEHPQLLFLQETKLCQGEMDRVRRKLKYQFVVAVDCGGEGRGRRGGLALLWNQEWEVSIKSFSLNHIDAMIQMKEGVEWRYTGFYGHPEEENKSMTTTLMEHLFRNDNMPWVCGGDFNLMIWSNEKKGGAEFNFAHAMMFRNALDHCMLEDLYYNGYPYTWTNNQGGEKNLQERLDRFCANKAWQDLYGGSFVTHLEKRKSDHLPIILSIKDRINTIGTRKTEKLFRFQEMWTREEDCEVTILNSWWKGEGVGGNLARTSADLREWSKKQFGNFAKETRECRTQMSNLMEKEPAEENVAMMTIDGRMDELEARKNCIGDKGVDKIGSSRGIKILNSFMRKQSRELPEII